MFTDDSFEKKGFDAETFEAKGGFDRNCKVCKGTGWMRKKGDPKDAKTAKLLGLSIDELTMQPCNAGGKDMGCFNAEFFNVEEFGVEYEDDEKHFRISRKNDGETIAIIDVEIDGEYSNINDALDAICDEKNRNVEQIFFGAESFSAEGILCSGCPEAGRNVVIRKDHTGEDGDLMCPFCHSNKNFKNIPVTTYLLHGGRKEDLMDAEESGLTRLPSDEPKFDPQKADRNKDGKISSWERTVGNKVAKGIREGRKTSSKGIDTFAEPFEEIGISKPYARLGVIAAGITALAFGVNKLRK